MRIGHSLTLMSTLLLVTAGLLEAQNFFPPRRLSAEFQNAGEKSTSARALEGGDGGTMVYSKTLSLPAGIDVIYVALTMVQLGLTFEGIGTALDLEAGLAYLNLRRQTRGAAGNAEQ